MNSLKEAFSMKNMLKNLNFFGELNLGLILTAVGIVYFKNPNHFAFGGTSGLSILLADLFPKINVGGFMWIINLILVVLGFVFLGIKTMGWTMLLLVWSACPVGSRTRNVVLFTAFGVRVTTSVRQ